MFKEHKLEIKEVWKAFRVDLITLGSLLFLLALFDVLLPYMTKVAIDNYLVPKRYDEIWIFAMQYGALILVFVGLIITFIIKAGRVESKFSYYLRKKTFDRMQDYKFSYMDHEGVGKIMARLTSDIGRLSEIVSWGVVDLVWAFTMMTALLVVMFLLNFKLALLISVTLPLIIYASAFFQKRIYKAQKKVRSINSEITGLINEGITGALTSKTLVTEEKNTSEFMKKTEEMKSYSIKSSTLSAMYMPITINIGTLGIVIAIIYGGLTVNTGMMTLGTLILFINYTTQFFEPVRELARILSDIQSAKVAAERVLTLLSQDLDGVVENPKDDFEIEGNIIFSNVDFSYDEREQVLDDFTLEVKKGEKIALVGETGAGKSTIVNLVCKFHHPTGGDIIIDGVNYKEITKEKIQSNLGYVLQTPHLFSGSIMDNIRYGKLEATDEEVIKAASFAQADHFIKELDDGYETKVGEGGSKLSAGEKQLISIARAILADPKIFVLDEATSSIDVSTESRIQKAIESVLENRTSFIIAHRLSTVKFADKIILLDKGKIVEIGKHDDLMKKKGRYYNLYMNQFNLA